MIVHWTDLAVENLADIHEYVSRTSPGYATSIIDRLIRRSEQIGTFPQSGRIVPEFTNPQLREVFEEPYRIVYRVKEGQIDVLAVVHGSRAWPRSS